MIPKSELNMEELLQSVTSVRKNIQERRNSRTRAENLQKIDLKLQLSSPRSGVLQNSSSKGQNSKTELEKSSFNRLHKQNQDEFSRFLQSPLRSPQSAKVKLSPSRKKTYKIDAAALLVSRVKKFLIKKLRIWKEAAEKIRSFEKGAYKRELIFKANIAKKPEKPRYISRGRDSDEEIVGVKNPGGNNPLRISRGKIRIENPMEIQPKSCKNRMSPRSPVLLDFNKSRLRVNSKGSDQRPPIVEVLVEESIAIKPKPCKMMQEKISPTAGKPPFSFMRMSVDKPLQKLQAKKNPHRLILVISKLVYKNIKITYKHLQNYKKLLVFHSVLASKLLNLFHITTSSLFTHITSLCIIEASYKISDIFANKIAEIFFFMKFRCVIESGLFEDSSKDDLKECLETLKRPENRINIDKKLPKKSLSYLLLMPSFVNLILSLESKVRVKYYLEFCKIVIGNNEKVCFGVRIIEKLYKKNALEAFRALKRYGITCKFYRKVMKNLCDNLEKDVKYCLNATWKHWKLLVVRNFNDGRFELQGQTMLLVFDSIIRQRKKTFFNVYAIIKNQKLKIKPKTQYSIIKGTKRLRNYIKSLKRKVFYAWVLRPQRFTRGVYYNLHHVLTIFIKFLKISIGKWRQKSKILTFYKTLALKKVIRMLRKKFKLHLNTWQSKSSTNYTA